MQKNKTEFLILLLGWLMMLSPAQAASFDCAKASTTVEHIICDNSEVSELDEELTAKYTALLKEKIKAAAITQSQRMWLKNRNACSDVACVKQAYETRVQELASQAGYPAKNFKRKQRFKVTEGKGYSVCENYARFLNSLPESEPLPLCHLKHAPDFPGLTEPHWEEMDIQSHLKLVYSIEKIISPGYHDRPVDTFEHWKTVYERQIHTGEISPRLRRTHLALLANAPIETILAYEPDRNSCDKNVKRQGYAYDNARTRLFIWSERNRDVEQYKSWIAFSTIPKLMLYRGTPLLFFNSWGSNVHLGFVGEIYVSNFVSGGVGNQYGHVPRCTISFKLPSTIIERMKK